MFLNDPMLYGASFPYRDIGTPLHTPFAGQVFTPWQNIPSNMQLQTPFAGPVFTPWQHIPRFVPSFYGLQQPFMGVPQMINNPYLQTTAFNPYVQPFNLNLPQLNWCRPFTY